MIKNSASCSLQQRAISRNARLVFFGFCMGCADVVPGVSGGTIALILGIYEKLVQSIRSIASKESLNALAHLQIKTFWREINGSFLIALGSGIFLAIFTLAQAIEHLLLTQPTCVWSVFFGLVLASVFLVGARIRKWSAPLCAAFVVGAVGAYVIVGMVPVETPETWWFLVFSGAIAICAMILPGVSGSFILVILGKYEFVLHAVNERDIGTILIFGAGAIVGLLAFSKVLSYLLRRNHDVTIAVLTGLMLGSLRHIWPWKVVENGAELLRQNVFPKFMENGMLYTETFVLIGLMGVGIILILFLQKVADGRDETSN